MKRFKRLVAFALSIVFLFATLPQLTTNVYAEENWKAWSQSDSRWGSILLGSSSCTMSEYGCLVTSVAKIMVQSGHVNSDTFNVGTLINWLNANNNAPNYSFTPDGGLYFAKPAEMVAGFTLVDHQYGVNHGIIGNAADCQEALLGLVGDNYHIILAVNNYGHYIAVDNAKSLSTGEIYIMDSLASGQNADVRLVDRYSSIADVLVYNGWTDEGLENLGNANGTLSPDENGDIYFSTFEELKQIAAGTYEWTYAYYEGTEPLIISEDLYLPENLSISANDAKIVVPANVIFSILGAQASANTLIVEGSMYASNLNVYEKLEITGSLNLSYSLTLHDAELIGEEKLTCYTLNRSYTINDEASLHKAVETANCAVDTFPESYFILNISGTIILNESLSIPENCQTNIYGSLTVKENVVLVNYGYDVFRVRGKLIVEGTLDNYSEIAIMYDDGGRLSVAENGICICSWGIFTIYSDELTDVQAAVSGLNLIDFEVTEYNGYYGHYWELAPNVISSEDSRLVYFTTFEGLKKLASRVYDTETTIQYIGTEPLVIAEDLILPSELILHATKDAFSSGHIIIPAGVTLEANLFTDVLVVEGTLRIDNFATFIEESEITGSIHANGNIYLQTGSKIVGQDNIVYENESAKLWRNFDVSDEAQLHEAVAIANASIDPGERFAIHTWNEDYRNDYDGSLTDDAPPIILNKSVTIPANCTLSGSLPLTVTEGIVLTLSSCESGPMYNTWLDKLTVEGHLVNERNIYCDDDPDTLTITETGSYSGKGSIIVNGCVTTDLQTVLPGLNLYIFEIEETIDGDDHCWVLTIREEESENVFIGSTRIFGATRYDTAFKAADQLKENLGIEKFENIVVAYGEDFADALSGSYLANQKNAPILLVKNRNKEINLVKDYIKANLTPGGTVYLLGGVNAVPKAMENGLEGFNVKRLAGATRYETNLEILKEAGISGNDILVCTGLDFADGLSASAVNKPILLVKDSLRATQVNYLKTLGTKNFYLIGGTNAVNKRIENALKTYGTTQRVEGATRYYTSVNIAKTFFPNAKTAVLAYAQNFPDGLSGGCLACSMNAPLILTANGKQAPAVAYAKEAGITGGAVLGGTGLIPDKVVNAIFQIS